MKTIREKVLRKQKSYMRILPDEFYENNSRDDILKEFERIKEHIPSLNNLSLESLSQKLKAIQRTRHFGFWHDGSTLSNHGHLLMMIVVMYDPAIFYTSQEYKEKTGM